MYEFKLYIAGQTSKSLETVKELNDFLRENCTDEYDVKVVDVLRHTKEALDDSVFATPALIRINPKPEKRAFGSFRQVDRALEVLFK